MKKSLIALAVAGAFAAPAFAATSNVDVYGVMNIAIEDTNENNVDVAVLDNTSRIGFKGTEDLGGGLKAVWQIESAIGGNGDVIGEGNEVIGTRNTFIGLAGGFGTVLMGKHDTPYKLGTVSLDIFGDTIGDYNLGRLNGVDPIMNTHDHRDAQALAYVSPTWSGFHFAAAAVMSDAKQGGSGLANANDSIDAISATAVYSNGPLFGSLSYQDVDAVDSQALKLGLGYTFGDTAVGFVYEDVEVGAGDRDSWLLNVKHAMGPIVLKGQYGSVDKFGVDQDVWMIGVDYNMSKRTTAYFVYGVGDSDAAIVSGVGGAATTSVAGDVSGWNIGMKHSF